MKGSRVNKPAKIANFSRANVADYKIYLQNNFKLIIELTKLPASDILYYKISQREINWNVLSTARIFDKIASQTDKYYFKEQITFGKTYSLKIWGINYSSEGEISDSLVLKAFYILSFLNAPLLKFIDSSSITLELVYPQNDGGCRIKGFYLYRNSGLGDYLIKIQVQNNHNKQ